jgi:hypothetical protein
MMAAIAGQSGRQIGSQRVRPSNASNASNENPTAPRAFGDNPTKSKTACCIKDRRRTTKRYKTCPKLLCRRSLV